jgi:hypothetical protein
MLQTPVKIRWRIACYPENVTHIVNSNLHGKSDALFSHFHQPDLTMGDLNVHISLPKPVHLWNVKTNQTFTLYSWHHRQCLCKHLESLRSWFLTVKQNLMHILFMKVWPLHSPTMIAEPIQHKQTNKCQRHIYPMSYYSNTHHIYSQ